MKVFYNVNEIKTARQEQRDNPIIYRLHLKTGLIESLSNRLKET